MGARKRFLPRELDPRMGSSGMWSQQHLDGVQEKFGQNSDVPCGILGVVLCRAGSWAWWSLSLPPNSVYSVIWGAVIPRDCLGAEHSGELAWLVNNNYFNSLSCQWYETALGKYVGTRKLWRDSRMHGGGLGKAGNGTKTCRLTQKMLALAEIEHFFCLGWFYCRLQETELGSWHVKACTYQSLFLILIRNLHGQQSSQSPCIFGVISLL